jgi:hypothetical protein
VIQQLGDVHKQSAHYAGPIVFLGCDPNSEEKFIRGATNPPFRNGRNVQRH